MMDLPEMDSNDDIDFAGMTASERIAIMQYRDEAEAKKKLAKDKEERFYAKWGFIVLAVIFGVFTIKTQLFSGSEKSAIETHKELLLVESKVLIGIKTKQDPAEILELINQLSHDSKQLIDVPRGGGNVFEKILHEKTYAEYWEEKRQFYVDKIMAE
jgi:hypothetical protein